MNYKLWFWVVTIASTALRFLINSLGSSFPKFSFILFGRSIGVQAGYVSPLLFLIFIVATLACIKKAYQKKDRRTLIIACFVLPVLVLFNGIDIFNEILPHWFAMGYLALSIYVAHLTLKNWHIKWFRIYSYATWGLAIFMIIVTIMRVLYGIIPLEKFQHQSQIEKIEHGIAKPERIDITNEVYGAYPSKEKPFVFTYKSYLASELATSVPELKVFCISDKIDAYDLCYLWQRNLDTLRNKDGLFLCNDFFFSNPKERYGEKVFVSYTDVEIFPVYRGVRKIKNFFFTMRRSFNPANLPYEYTADALGQKKELMQELIKFDHIVFKFINSDLKCKFLDFYVAPISYCDSKNFNISFFVILIISIAILWRNKKDSFWTNLVLLASVIAITSIATFFLKCYFERPRPLIVFGDENVNTLFEKKIHKNSFPSGHTSIAVALCAFMFMMVKKYWRWYIFFAVASGFYRIYAGSHFPYDVLAGATLGIISAYTTVTFFRKYSKI
ncbi:MAG: phosphatase PAP2 family protein [Endomicrobium sp.]|uniref:phosphatase PAP2 family protein n=1 Tax=Candidatus Endomicrobiellum pyrsonymphae TaxID=1408203 RepID=UPI00357D6464|nr:phosphatase PAP2 family protein [Endomicrobium sp.]